MAVGFQKPSSKVFLRESSVVRAITSEGSNMKAILESKTYDQKTWIVGFANVICVLHLESP